MKKIPTLFIREFDDNHDIKNIYNKLTDPSLDVVLQGKCIPTVKIDGSCCAIINNEFYIRYDVKHGKKPPENGIPCCKPDPVTGHWPHWLPIDKKNKAVKWYIKAFDYSSQLNKLSDGTYEAIGPHFNGNPYNLKQDKLYRHGSLICFDLEDYSFEGIKKYLEEHYIEGIVFWYEGQPLCKIKRSDFGFPWNINKRG